MTASAQTSAQETPERIYGWRTSQLSIARHYGGISFNGKHYMIDMADPDQPLVREDVLKAELKAVKAAKQKPQSVEAQIMDFFK